MIYGEPLTQEAIDNLIDSPEFQHLLQIEPEFNLFDALGISSLERAHSALLFYFLNPKEFHGCGYSFLKGFLDLIWGKFDGLKVPSHAKVIPDGTPVRMEREVAKGGRGFLDLLISFESLKFVIGVEVKVWHSERAGQLSDYQEMIQTEFGQRYRDWYLVYLTPSGLEPTTHNDKSSVKCLPLSWAELVPLFSASSGVTHNVAVKNLLHSISTHIERDFMTSSAEKQLIDNLWADPKVGKTLGRILGLRPDFTHQAERWVALVQAFLKDNNDQIFNEPQYYPERGRVAECKIQINSWHQIGFPITFMLYNYASGPAMRVLAYKDDLKNSRIEEFCSHPQKDSQVSKPENTQFLINKRFSRISDWTCWHRIFEEDEYPSTSYLSHSISDPEVPMKAFEKFREAYDFLDPLIKQLSQGN